MLARCLRLQRLLTVGEGRLKRGGTDITARAGGEQSGSPEKVQGCPQSRGRYGAVPKPRSSCDSQVASPLHPCSRAQPSLHLGLCCLDLINSQLVVRGCGPHQASHTWRLTVLPGALCMNLGPSEARREHQIPWDWNYRRLLAACRC